MVRPSPPMTRARIRHSRSGVAPAHAFAKRSDTALLLFVLGVLGFAGGRVLLRARPSWGAHLPTVAVGASVLVWLSFLPSFLEIPLKVGFDARHHHDYVAHLRDAGTVPLATDGWSMFHPPLFYVATLIAGAPFYAATLIAGVPAGETVTALAFRTVPFLGGLATVLLAFALVRGSYPNSPRAQSFAVGFAALLPVNIYSSAYFSNESLHSALASAALLVTVGLLLAARASLPRVAALGTVLGLALLTKFTAVCWSPFRSSFWSANRSRSSVRALRASARGARLFAADSRSTGRLVLRAQLAGVRRISSWRTGAGCRVPVTRGGSSPAFTPSTTTWASARR